MNPTPDDDELDRVLADLWRDADAGTRAPAGFDARLFARIEREAPRPLASAGVLSWSRPALPWWVRAAGERHVALALAIAGAIVAWPTWWATNAASAGALGAGLAAALDRALTPLVPALFAPLMAPKVALLTAACLAPAIAWASYQAGLAVERWVRRAALAGARVARAQHGRGA
jgi:hypothetical protein